MKYLVIGVAVISVALGACRREVPYDTRIVYEEPEVIYYK